MGIKLARFPRMLTQIMKIYSHFYPLEIVGRGSEIKLQVVILYIYSAFICSSECLTQK